MNKTCSRQKLYQTQVQNINLGEGESVVQTRSGRKSKQPVKLKYVLLYCRSCWRRSVIEAIIGPETNKWPDVNILVNETDKHRMLTTKWMFKIKMQWKIWRKIFDIFEQKKTKCNHCQNNSMSCCCLKMSWMHYMCSWCTKYV